MYLDADDTLAPDTVKACVDFFDRHHDEVDLVTYKEQPYKDGKKAPVHFRYEYLKKDGIYDLTKYPYITQTRVNICVKNLHNENILFDESFAVSQEDQEYCSQILAAKLKIGYITKGEYKYTTDNNESIRALKFNPIHIFEFGIQMFEDLFMQFEEKVPHYYQALCIHDFNWKMGGNIFFPYHYAKDDFNTALKRISELLRRIDGEVILNHPEIDSFHKHYWLNMKPNLNAAVIALSEKVDVFSDNKKIFSRDKFEIIVHKIIVRGEKFRLAGFVKSILYNYVVENASVYAIENGDEALKKKIDVFLSSDSNYHCRTHTNNFWAFFYECNVNEVHDFRFTVEVDGFSFGTTFWFYPTAVIDVNLERTSFTSENTKITFRDGAFFLENTEDTFVEAHDFSKRFKKSHIDVFILRENAIKIKQQKHIWLYFDMPHVLKDNGYYQFQNDFNKPDGIERYYISGSSEEDNRRLFTDKQLPQVVAFGSGLHKTLYLAAEKILTAFVGKNSISPFTGDEEKRYYVDLMSFEIIYLQHGILHASYRQSYAAEWCYCDKVVVSSHFEVENFQKNYDYQPDMLLQTGMARYDHIDKTKEPKRKILFAPSWRSYFAVQDENTRWYLVKEKFVNSSYYKNIKGFLESYALQEMLTLNGYELHVKFHPIVADAGGVFDTVPERVAFVGDDIEIEDYSVFVTDFSSFVFDFVYLQRAILYFVPDYLEFKCGIYPYRELDLPFEKAFGELAITPEDAAVALGRLLEHGAAPEAAYRQRMDGFFLHDGRENCERLYQKLTGEEK
jgi:hypothetical protein